MQQTSKNLGKGKTKTPVCVICGRVLNGRVPIDAEQVTCFLCCNAMDRQEDENKRLTRWKDKR